MDRYHRTEPTNSSASNIGEGAYGVVYKGRDLVTNDDVALKKIRLEGDDEGIPATALREIIVLKQLRHDNVVHLRDVVLETGRLYLVFELVHMDLKKLMDSYDVPLQPSLVRSYVAQILDGLAYIHSMGIMHRDLKPQNLLVTKSGSIKLADFGLARTFTPSKRELTVEVITRWYRAPEILLGCSTYTSCVDVWSVGCIMAEMANKRALFPGDSEIDQVHRIFRCFGTPDMQMWGDVSMLPFWRNNFPNWKRRSLSSIVPSVGEDGWALMDRLLHYDPRERTTAAAALKMPYVSGILSQSGEAPAPSKEMSAVADAVADSVSLPLQSANQGKSESSAPACATEQSENDTANCVPVPTSEDAQKPPQQQLVNEENDPKQSKPKPVRTQLRKRKLDCDKKSSKSDGTTDNGDSDESKVRRSRRGCARK